MGSVGLHNDRCCCNFCAHSSSQTVPMPIRFRQTTLVKQAASCLDTGGIVAYPTEAVWGLGCDPMNREATLRLLQIKARPVEKGMILVAASTEQLGALYGDLDTQQREQLAQSWPGPFTWLLPDPQGRIPWWIRGDHDTVAVRVSAHPVVVALCNAFGGPLVSTSANRAGQPPARSRLQVMTRLRQAPDLIVPGALGGEARPSTIRDLRSGKILR